jgi:hypothetical protein
MSLENSTGEDANFDVIEMGIANGYSGTISCIAEL